MVDPSQYLQQFPAAFAPLKSSFDLTSLSTLYSSVDFIGISAYPSLTPNFTTNQIESATQQFDLEVKEFGINLKDLIFNKVTSLCPPLPWSVCQTLCWSARSFAGCLMLLPSAGLHACLTKREGT